MNFTMEVSREDIFFLDTTVKLRDRTLHTDLFCKPTDSHNSLLYSSALPYHYKNSIPYNQFLWITRICINRSDFDRHALAFYTFFHDSGYPSHLIKESYIKVRRLNKNNLLDPPKLGEEKPIDNKIILVTIYHPHDMTFPKRLSSNWDILVKSHNTSLLHKK